MFRRCLTTRSNICYQINQIINQTNSYSVNNKHRNILRDHAIYLKEEMNKEQFDKEKILKIVEKIQLLTDNEIPTNQTICGVPNNMLEEQKQNVDPKWPFLL